ncbi:hypothetical protein [Aeromicrobium sp. CTD01-1L150]|uniref:hypothetical protein n=1 Tax=Aeromicrobium sp. CTD01-1L150 TaxID=3341830 RepID=UPI0035BED3F2
MNAARGIASVALAWGAWLMGHAVLTWRGDEYFRQVLVRDGWSGIAVVGLLAVIVGCLLFAAAAASLALSWWGLLSVGVVQTLIALLSWFLWGSALSEFFIPQFLVTALYLQHLFLGVHLALGVIAVALALAVPLRPRLTIGRDAARLLSLVAVVPALLAIVPLVEGGRRNTRALQVFASPETLALLLLVVAAALLAIAALAAVLSGTGPAVAGALLSLIGLVGLLTPSSIIEVSSSGFAYSLFHLAAAGGLLAIGVVLGAGALASSIAARFAPKA